MITALEALEKAKQVINLQQEVIKNLTAMLMVEPINFPAPTPGSIDADGTVTPDKSGGLDYQTAKRIEAQDM